HAAVDASDAELGIAPPESAFQLLPSLRRDPLLRDRPQQRLGAVERGQTLLLLALLHATNRVGGELTDLAAERGGEHLPERRRRRPELARAAPGPRGARAEPCVAARQRGPRPAPT